MAAKYNFYESLHGAGARSVVAAALLSRWVILLGFSLVLDYAASLVGGLYHAYSSPPSFSIPDFKEAPGGN